MTGLNEQSAARAFDKQAPLFDDLYGKDAIVQYKRKRVRDHTEQFLQPHSRILELNAGTGEDALYFSAAGHSVHATDISAAMQEILIRKVTERGLGASVTHERCSFTELEDLRERGPFDCIFSNFAGLNCTDRLDKVLSSFSWLVKPGGFVTLVILPRFCLWEFLLLFRGRFKTAFRRFSGKKGTRAHIEGEYFRCWYYNPAYVRDIVKDSFEVIGLEGLCSIVPPSYIRDFAVKHPKWFSYLRKKEDKWKSRWPWKVWGDYYIISLRKRNVEC